MPLQFEWDPAKNRSNLAKHGIPFDEASTAFDDVLSMTIPDPLHSEHEERLILLGRSSRDRLVVVAHTETKDVVRIISARTATKRERRLYEENEK
jgi:uncharacterized protein